MKRLMLIGAAVVVGLALALPVRAQDVVVGGPEITKRERVRERIEQGKEQPVLVEITVTGRLSKHEARYVLTQANGVKVPIQAKKMEKPGEAAIDLEPFVGKEVTVTGKGRRMPAGEQRPERMVIGIVTSVKEAAGGEAVQTPKTEAPAAPEAPAAE